MPNKGKLEKVAAILFAFGLWQVVAIILDRSVLLVTPLSVARRLLVLMSEQDFFSVIAFSLFRIFGGCFAAMAVGIILAVIAGRFHLVEVLLWPFIQTIKSVPVASFIILCLIWLTSKNLSVFIAFLMVLPIIYTNVFHGIKETDSKLLEMALIFRAGWLKKIRYIYLPHIKPYLISACSVSFGLSWKAGIAAEVIGIPDGSIGEKLYEAKVYLSSADLFAWTVVIVVLSILFEKAFIRFLKRLFLRLERS
ncbi:MAG: ABC transporter permease subunit [Clostridia bacterium]|nr:ABC transporter permease subunit [Clostridia bacterium]